MSINYDQVNLMFKMLIPNKLTKKEKGDFFEAVTACLFKRQRWKINRNEREPGVQIDIQLEDFDTQEKAAVECKFHKDKIGSDEVSKIISTLSSYDYSRGFLLSASELDGEAKKLVDNFNNRNNNKLTVWSGEKLVEIFRTSYNIEEPNLDMLPNICITRMTFLITYNQEFIWVAEHIDTILENSYAFIFPVNKHTNNHSVDYWKNYFDKFKIYQKYHLELIDENNHNFTFYSTLKSEFKEIPISRIMNADSFEDYHLPSNPQDFFGRIKAKEIFWNFLEDVRNGNANSRIVCLEGNTGIGKSSLLVKLREESTQEKYQGIYIRDIDVTAVRDDKVKYFIANAIQKTLQEYIDKEFIKITNNKIQIDSLEYPFFESSSIKSLRRKLIEERKLIVIFFDQFEEVLTKNSWSSIYQDFIEVAQEINYIQENIVFGFSWREDIDVPVTSPTYYYWQTISDMSKIINLNELAFSFSEEDIKQALKKFEMFLVNESNVKKLDPSIKKWILDNCQNMPWLLKKICGEIYRETLTYEYFQSKQIINNFDIKRIFDKDIDTIKKMGKNYDDCLNYIANNSPVLQQNVIDKYGRDVINTLLKKRLIIERESNYKIYADIFKQYIIDGDLPKLSTNFTPRTSIVIALKIFALLKSNLTKKEVADKLNLKYKGDGRSTIENAIQDLQKFLNIQTKKNSVFVEIDNNLIQLSDNQIAEVFAGYLSSHLLIQELYRKYDNEQCFHYNDFDQILLENNYVSSSGDTKDYRSRFLSWFCFAGLLEIREDEWIYIPIIAKQGKQKGKVDECVFKSKRRKVKSQGRYRQLNALDFLK